ncbi:hypothetical protein JHK87_049906 [Glycine soja]|nr:hypothetical protein JHK87_049906 [Glycine soja]
METEKDTLERSVVDADAETCHKCRDESNCTFMRDGTNAEQLRSNVAKVLHTKILNQNLIHLNGTPNQTLKER